MIRINEAGPLMKEYADCYGCEAKDVVAWVNDYVNGPWPDDLKAKLEPTEKERLEAIRGYIEAMVMDSVSRRVKNSIKERKECESKRRTA